MRKSFYKRFALELYCVLVLVALPHAVDATPLALNIRPAFDNSTTLTPIPDVKQGDQVLYSLNLNLQHFSIVFAWGAVTFADGSVEKLMLQFKSLKPGAYSLYWQSTAPFSSTGQASVKINYFSLLGGCQQKIITFNVLPGDSNNAYVGSDKCMSCHVGFNIVNEYKQSGHFFALSAVAGKAPVYPPFAPGVPEPPAGASWSDILYVIGGYAWSANFASLDNGTVLTGPAAQYNPANSMLGTPAEFVSYTSDASTPGQFTCGACHATGYSPEGHQDNRSSIVGTWFENAVGCEGCHGPGVNHAYNPSSGPPPFDPTTSCANCHERNSQSVVEADAGLIRHEQQAGELKTAGHRFVKCTVCHHAHASAHFDAAATGMGIIKQCTSCHTNVTVGLGMQSLTCIDCHMPYAVKAGASISFTDSANNAYELGDMRSHIFKINTVAAGPAEMFTDNGSQLALDAAGFSGGLTLNFACLSCHRTGGRASNPYTYDQAKIFAKSIHAQ